MIHDMSNKSTLIIYKKGNKGFNFQYFLALSLFTAVYTAGQVPVVICSFYCCLCLCGVFKIIEFSFKAQFASTRALSLFKLQPITIQGVEIVGLGLGLGIRGRSWVGLGVCKVGGVRSGSDSSPWISCSAISFVAGNERSRDWRLSSSALKSPLVNYFIP